MKITTTFTCWAWRSLRSGASGNQKGGDDECSELQGVPFPAQPFSRMNAS